MTTPILFWALSSTSTLGLLIAKASRQRRPDWSARGDGVLDRWLVRSVALTFASALIVVALSAGAAVALACGVAGWATLRVLGVHRIK